MFKPLDRSEKDSREGKIRFLLRRKFPALFNVPRVSPEEYPALKEQAEQYRKVLDAKQDAELDSYYTMEKAEARRVKLDRDEAARAFNQPFARSDVSRWAKMSYWRPDEAVALSLGCEPKYAQWDELQHLTLVSAFASKFASQREIVMRARAMGQLSDMTIPSHFMAWAERMQFPMPDELSVAVKELGRQVADWKSLFDNQLRETEEAVELAKHLQGQYSSEMHRQSKAILEMAELNQAITKKWGRCLNRASRRTEC